MAREPKKKRRADIRSAGEELTRELVFPNLQPSYNKFRQQVGKEIDAAISAITAAHQVIERESLTWPKDQQAAHVRLFVYTALNNLVLTTHFIVAGYHQPAGQQLRSFAEGSAMALLLLLPKEWKQFEEAPMEYPAHKSLGRVQRESNFRALEKMVSLDAKAWADFVKITKRYDHHSHAGALTTLLHVRLTWPYQSILGGEFDREKKTAYKTDLGLAKSGAANLSDLCVAIGKHLRSREV